MGEVHSELTDPNLKELGISFGPRKKLLRAIVKLQSGPATLLSETLPLADRPDRSHAERRRLTVLFCNLAGSSALAEPLIQRNSIGLDCRRLQHR